MIIDWKGPLLACPFCGKDAVMEQEAGSNAYSIGCDGAEECPGRYAELATFARKIEAANAWNTRDGKLDFPSDDANGA